MAVAFVLAVVNRFLRIGLLSKLAEQVVFVMVPPLGLIFLVLGTIFIGVATPTEGGAMGAAGAIILALMKGRLSFDLTRQAAESTASVEVCADAISRAGSLDKEKVRNALAKTNLMAFYGPVKFDATGKNVAKSMVMYQVQHEKYVVVAPSKWASAKPIYPAPPWDKRESDSKVSRK